MLHDSRLAADHDQIRRFAIPHHDWLTVSLNDPQPSDGAIHDVTLIDVCGTNLIRIVPAQLAPGAQLLLEIPLIGWREAQIRWIADNRVGCRLAEPLDLEELRLAAVGSERLAGECPALAAAIAAMPSLRRQRPISPRQSNLSEQHAAIGAPSLALVIGLVVLGFVLVTWWSAPKARIPCDARQTTAACGTPAISVILPTGNES